MKCSVVVAVGRRILLDPARDANCSSCIRRSRIGDSNTSVSEVLLIMSDAADAGGSITSSELAKEDALIAVPTLTLIATVAYHAGCNGADKAITQGCEKMLNFTLSTHFNEL